MKPFLWLLLILLGWAILLRTARAVDVTASVGGSTSFGSGSNVLSVTNNSPGAMYLVTPSPDPATGCTVSGSAVSGGSITVRVNQANGFMVAAGATVNVSVLMTVIGAYYNSTRTVSFSGMPLTFRNAGNTLQQTVTFDSSKSFQFNYGTGGQFSPVPLIWDTGAFDILPLAVGTVIVNGQLGLSGPARLVTQGYEGSMYNFTLNGTAGQQAIQTWNPASLVANGATLTVQFRLAADPVTGVYAWQTVASGAVSKAPDGSFAVVLTVSGEGDTPQAGPDDGVFELDVVSYDAGAKTVQLEVDGVLYSPQPPTIGGDPVEGTRNVLRVTIPDAGLSMSGKAFKWVISGMYQGVAVNRLTVATGTVPAGPLVLAGGEIVQGAGFLVQSSATLGAPSYTSPDLPPETGYDPNAGAPPGETPEEAAKREAKKDDYESTRKATEDGLAELLDAGPGMAQSGGPSSGEADAVHAEGQEAGEGMADAVAAAGGAVGGFGASTFSGTVSSLTLNFPVYGPATLNLAAYDPWPGLIRAVLLVWFGWLAAVTGARIFRGAFAG